MLKRLLVCFLIVILAINNCVKAETLSAKSAVLYEPVSERILFSKNENEKLPMASTTKILTGITAIENCDISEVATVSANAANTEGSSVWLEEGEKITVENLLYGLLLSSGNDAAVAIAEHISGSTEEFSKLMNNTARKAGALNSNFMNPSGLDNIDHYTTAYDLARITTYAMKNELFRQIVSTKIKTIPWQGHTWDRQLKNHNKLLNIYDGANGVKTGFTKKDGRCLVGSANKNGIQLITVTLNAPDDWNDHIKMFEFGYSILKKKIIPIKEFRIKVEGGVKKYITVKNKIFYEFPYLDKDSIKTNVIIPDSLTAPVKNNKVVGYEEVFLNNKKIYEIPIITTEIINQNIVPDFRFYLMEILK